MIQNPSQKILRIFAAGTLCISAFVSPWYLVIVFALTCFIFFDSFYEALVAGFIFDELHGARIGYFFHFYFVLSLCIALLFVVSVFIKERVKFYHRIV